MPKQRRDKGSGSISQRPNGRWRCQIPLPNGRRVSHDCASKDEAVRWGRQQLAGVDQGLDVSPQRLTVEHLVRRWLEVCQHTLRTTTYQSYAGECERHILPELGRYKLAALRPDHLQQYYARELAAGLSARTVQYHHALIRAALNQAVRWGLVARNVTAAVRPPRVERPQRQTLATAQVTHLLQVARTAKGGRWYPLLALALLTGMRQGELLGLHWRDVDLERGVLEVLYTAQRVRGNGIVMAEPKTERSRRQVHLAPMAVTALRAHYKAQLQERLIVGRDWDDQDLVFCTHAGRPLSARNVVREFDLLLEAAELPHIRFHDLRHITATFLQSLGVAPAVVQELLGHAEVSTTLDFYSHAALSMQADAVLQLQHALEGRVAGA